MNEKLRADLKREALDRALAAVVDFYNYRLTEIETGHAQKVAALEEQLRVTTVERDQLRQMLNRRVQHVP